MCLESAPDGSDVDHGKPGTGATILLMTCDARLPRSVCYDSRNGTRALPGHAPRSSVPHSRPRVDGRYKRRVRRCVVEVASPGRSCSDEKAHLRRADEVPRRQQRPQAVPPRDADSQSQRWSTAVH